MNPGRYLKAGRKTKRTDDLPSPARVRTPRHRSIPLIAVRSHLPRKTSQLTGEPELKSLHFLHVPPYRICGFAGIW